MNEAKREVIETALSDINEGADLESVLGLVYNHGRFDATEQISESDNPGDTARGMVLEMFLEAVLEAAGGAGA